MESSPRFVGGGGAGKWSGTSESGWTMYIGSPSNHGECNGVVSLSSNDKGAGDDKTKENKASLEYYSYYGYESDDSMASDASSGQIHCEIGERSHAGTGHKHAAKEVNVKKPCIKKKKGDETVSVKKGENDEETMLHRADSAASHV